MTTSNETGSQAIQTGSASRPLGQTGSASRPLGQTGSASADPLNTEKDVGPDPVIGAGVTLLGIFLMGVGGAWDAHYLFDFGVLTGVLGAFLFVLFVTVTALKQRRA